MDAFSLLNPAIRAFVFQEGWQKLRPIQEASIQMMVKSDHNLILSAPTAGGKTEAAYFPAISLVQDWKGVKILTISPMIALINDQMKRVERLCSSLDLPITAWHGEASLKGKNDLRKNPSGLMMITPESLEAMLDTRVEQVHHFFSNLEFVIIDELHVFLGENRGEQLRSLLFRLSRRVGGEIRFLGLSASLSKGSFPYLKEYFPSKRKTSILVDSSRHDFTYQAFYHKEEDQLHSQLFEEISRENMLVFPNSRRQVEELVQAMKKRARRKKKSLQIFAHHSSIEKNVRLDVEEFAKNPYGRFSIFATSSLELGIDIASVDAIGQVDAPFSISSLGQRMGRSGRGEYYDPVERKMKNDKSKLYFHARDPWAYLQGMAAISAIKEGLVEDSQPILKPYDVLAHQILAFVLENSGRSIKELQPLFDDFPMITDVEKQTLLVHLLKEDYLEDLDGDLILGLKGEKLSSHYDFYSMFSSPLEYSLYFNKERIGSLPLEIGVRVGARIYLAARVWEILHIDHEKRKMEATIAKEGQAPQFSGQAVDTSSLLRHKMLEMLNRKSEDPVIRTLQKDFSNENIQLLDGDRLVCFLGTKMERSLYLYFLNLLDGEDSIDLFWSPKRACIYGRDLRKALEKAKESKPLSFPCLKNYLKTQKDLVEQLLGDLKYRELLPDSLKIAYILYNLCDTDATFFAIFLEKFSL